MNAAEKTIWIIEQARAVGFDLCGVVPASDFEELSHLPEWLARGYAGEMKYLHDPRRNSIQSAMPGARSVIVCALNYNSAFPNSTEAVAGIGNGCRGRSSDRPVGGSKDPPLQEESIHRGWISRYAWGDDYHEILGARLDVIVSAMRENLGRDFDARAYVDTGPIVERVAAKYAGLGWLGKNTCLINEQLGSWLFLGVIVTTLELTPSLNAAESPPPDLCGNCRLCLDACPTEALLEPYVLDARRCISYLTIELRNEIPEELRAAMGWHVFGCDICQDVCPYNRKAPITSEGAFQPRTVQNENGKEKMGNREANQSTAPWQHSLFAPELEWLASLSPEEFFATFRNSAIKRTKWRGLVRNACVALGNSKIASGTEGHRRVLDLLEKLAGQSDELISSHARWAMSQLQNS
ncbi:MAG: tRNA epoxyqueuosine(34) reductase QueG [Acidobacteria bacterium]|nr:tRNA epoxyqueuosine(34) reductase QueG [Acidobacteriota bacterium]